MTNSQIEVILNDIGGYSLNQLIPGTEISSIALASDHSLYPTRNTRLKFVHKSGINLLEIYDGKFVNDTFVPNDNPSTIVTFESIEAINVVNAFNSPEPYRTGRSA